MPSPSYEANKVLFDNAFPNGIDQYVHPTGFIGVRIVRNVEENMLDPYYSSPYGQRAKAPGDFSIFLAENEETARAEVFQDGSFSGYPPNSWSLQYSYQGNILDVGMFPDPVKSMFLEPSGERKHECSQDLRFYLNEKGCQQLYDSIGWPSVQAHNAGAEGFVYNWISGVMPSFEFKGKTRLDI